MIQKKGRGLTRGRGAIVSISVGVSHPHAAGGPRGLGIWTRNDFVSPQNGLKPHRFEWKKNKNKGTSESFSSHKNNCLIHLVH